MDVIAVKVRPASHLLPNSCSSPRQVYEAMAFHVTQANFNRRIKAVSAWSLQMTATAVLSALRTMMNPMTEHLRELYSEGFSYDLIFPSGMLAVEAS